MCWHHPARAAVICLVLSGIAVPAQSGSTAVAMIAQASGDVLLERGAAKSPARLADLLYPGDRLSTGTGQVTFLFCPSSERITLPDHTSAELRSDGITVLKGVPPKRVSAKCLLPRVALGSESMERIGGLRARGEVPVLLYVGGSVASARPDFSWGPIKDATTYCLTLRDRDRNAVVWEDCTSSLNLAYPESIRPLEEKQYEWEVRAEAEAKTLARGTALFQVGPRRAPQAPDSSPDEKLLRAISLENEGYYSEAAAFYRELRDKNPDDVRLTKHLAWLYWNSGLIAAANEELKRLTALGVP